MRAVVSYPIPPKLNEQIRMARGHWSKSSREKKIWTNNISLLSMHLPRFPRKVWLDFEWLVKSYANDPDNVQAAAKYIMDGLTDAGVLTKDSLMIVSSPVVHRFGKGDDEVVLTISDSPIWELKPVEQGVAA